MAMPFSLRLDPATELKIRRLAAATRRSKSDVVREAVAQYGVERDEMETVKISTFDRLEPFAGIVSTGGADLSRDTHTKHRALVRKKSRVRRAR
jgi:predicted DNA-binding protein